MALRHKAHRGVTRGPNPRSPSSRPSARPPHRRVEDGSAVVEGIVAVAIVFILFTVVAQLAIALLAHQAAEAAVASAARQASVRPGLSEEQLLADLRATVPGAGAIEAGLANDGRLSLAWATFEFLPPGPMLRSFVFSVEAEVPVVVAP